MVIREIESDELEGFYECFEVLMEEGFSGYSNLLKSHFLNNDYSLERFRLWYTKKYRKIFIATYDSQIIGFVVGDYVYGGVGFISWIGVIKERRNKGIGKNLLKVYEEFAESRGAHLIELYTYEGIIKFYLDQGFEEIGRRKSGYFGQKNIIMNKKVGHWRDDILEEFPVRR